VFVISILVTLLLIALIVIGGAGSLYLCVAFLRRVAKTPSVPQPPASGEQNMSVPLPGDTPSNPSTPSFASLSSTSIRQYLVNSIGFRSALIGVLTLVMLIPLTMVGEVVDERSDRYQSVLDGIAGTWGKPQTLLAPVLIIPFTETYQSTTKVPNENGGKRTLEKTIVRQNKAHILPTDLVINVEIVDEVRHRGIFRSLVYHANVSVDASFEELDIASLSDHPVNVQWDKSTIAVGLSDTKAINQVNNLQWDSTTRSLAPGTGLDNLPTGFHAELDMAEDSGTLLSSHNVRLAMNVNGSGSFQFAPLGETTKVAVTSTWPHPSFIGSALPMNHTITDTGFDAAWNIPHLARNYAQVWTNQSGEVNLFEFTSGVSMFEPVSLYSRVIRAVKYGVLFIALTFLTLFVFEISVRRKMHLIQYALIGVSLSLFYLVLLSLSEHVVFLKAYIAASCLCILMISTYTGVVLSSTARGGLLLVLLAGLYTLLYSLLQMQDYALLMGTGLLVIVVMVLMFVTRNLQRLPVDTGSEAIVT